MKRSKKLLSPFSRTVSPGAPKGRKLFGSFFQKSTARLPSARLFRVTTFAGEPLCLRGDPPRLGTSRTHDPAAWMIAIIPDAMPHVCLLVSPDLRAFSVPDDPARSIAASALVLQTDLRGAVRLKYPLAGPAFLTVNPGAPQDDGPALSFHGPGNSTHAVFRLVVVREAELAVPVRRLAAEIAGAAAEGLRAATILARLRRRSLRPELAQALIRTMPRDELDDLAATLLRAPRLCAMLRRMLPDDPWVQTHLPALAGWHATRNEPPGHALRSPATDAHSLQSPEGRDLVPAGLALTSLARRSVMPRRLSCVLATARNEGPYLLDWLSYHLSIGFEHVFLYSNDNSDGSDALLDALARGGAITWIRNELDGELSPQSKAYTHALTMLPHILDYRWAAVLDLDEYLAFDTGIVDDAADFIGLQEAQSVDALALSWVMFAALPGERWSDASSLTRFTRRERNLNRHVKSLIRPRLFWKTQPHYPTATMDQPFEYRTEQGLLHHHPGVTDRLAAFAEQPSANQAWINHYFLRTAEEALWKWSRGRADWTEESQRDWYMEFVAVNYLELARPDCLVEDTRILSCARRQPAALERLLALPGVVEAEAPIKAAFAGQLRRLREQVLATPPNSNASAAVLRFRDILGAHT